MSNFQMYRITYVLYFNLRFSCGSRNNSTFKSKKYLSTSNFMNCKECKNQFQNPKIYKGKKAQYCGRALTISEVFTWMLLFLEG